MIWHGLRKMLALAALLGCVDCGGSGAVTVAGSSGTSSDTTTTTSVGPTATPVVVTQTVTQTVLVTTTVVVTASATGAGDSAASASSAALASSTTSSSPTPTPTSSPATPTATAAPHATPTTAAGALSPSTASDVVLAFLGALEKDPSGAASTQYLSQRLQAQLQQSGQHVISLLGVQNMYSAYRVEAPVSRGGGRAATVRATLTFGTGPVQRLFTLVPEGGAWKIEDISDSSA